ncbi:hypothetical protein J3R83DRAFT_1727 [Lanmaoa asiatica]|nr:hypothetical protein J3R83DRAFT_1727 [Lanmaoa asiatica]
MSPTATQSSQASCLGTICRWHDESASGVCGAVILCKDVPAHFKDIHSIKGINESVPVKCKWEECSAAGMRKYFSRHIRECHLGHSRKKGHSL